MGAGALQIYQPIEEMSFHLDFFEQVQIGYFGLVDVREETRTQKPTMSRREWANSITF